MRQALLTAFVTAVSVSASGALAAPSPSGAFASQIADAGPLSRLPIQTAPKQVPVQSVMYEPAPIPDGEASRPGEKADAPRATVAPRLFSQKTEFEGDGYFKGSSADAAREARSHPAAGLGWSVPVQY